MRHWQLRRCCVPLPFCGYDAARGFGGVTELSIQLFVVHSLFNLNAGPLGREDYGTCGGEVMVLFFPSLSVVQLTCPYEHVCTEPRGEHRHGDVPEHRGEALVLTGKNTLGAVSLHLCFLSDGLLALFRSVKSSLPFLAASLLMKPSWKLQKVWRHRPRWRASGVGASISESRRDGNDRSLRGCLPRFTG